MTDWWGIASSVAAVVSALGAGAVYAGQTRQADHELARSLHSDLTSGEVARSRNLLASFRHGDTAYGPEVREAYFTLLWCFERALEARRAMTRRHFGLVGRRSAAVRYFDKALEWHVGEWAEALPEIRSRLSEQLASRGGQLRDGDSRRSFSALVRDLRAAGLALPEAFGWAGPDSESGAPDPI